MHPQSRERRFECFASHIVEVDVDPVRRLPIQLFEYRTDFVIEGDIESAFFSQKRHLLHGTGRPDDTATAQFRELPCHIADGAGGLWFTDTWGIRYIGADGIIHDIAGGDDIGFAGDDAGAGRPAAALGRSGSARERSHSAIGREVVA